LIGDRATEPKADTINIGGWRKYQCSSWYRLFMSGLRIKHEPDYITTVRNIRHRLPHFIPNWFIRINLGMQIIRGDISKEYFQGQRWLRHRNQQLGWLWGRDLPGMVDSNVEVSMRVRQFLK
jgi:hypothetical protein